MARTYVSNKRRVNTCTECRRRKQRCNRQLPCHFCSLRGKPEECIFPNNRSLSISLNSGSVTHFPNDIEQVSTFRHLTTSPSPIPSLTRLSEDQDVVQLSSQIGYQANRTSVDHPDVVNELQADDPASGTRASVIQPQRLGKDEWSKYLRVAQILPKQCINHGLIDVFFNEANWYFTVLDRHFFDSAHRDWLMYGPKATDTLHKKYVTDSVFFPALLLQVLAVAIQFVPEQSTIASSMKHHGIPPNDRLSQTYSDAGERILDLLGHHHHSLVAVQADLMRCAWLKNSGQGSRAWYSLGSAIRQAQDIGLHLEPLASSHEDDPESLKELWRKESKRRLWACLFTWESHMALQLGRPCTVNTRDCTIAMPISADIPQDPSRTLFRPQAVSEGPPRSSSHIVKYFLAQKIQKLMASRSFTPDIANYSLIWITHQEVNDMMRSMSPCLHHSSPDTSWDTIRPDTVLHRLQIAIIIDSFLLALHRPHVKLHRESLDAAIEAATNVLECSQKLFEKLPKHQHKTFTLIFYSIDAGILLAAMMTSLQADDIRFKHGLQRLEQAISRLTILGHRNTAAVVGSEALSKCIQKLVTRNKTPADNDSCIHRQLLQPATCDHSQSRERLELNANPGSPLTTMHQDRSNLQGNDNLDNWDFLPTFDSPDDILTAMTVDSGYTSAWLEQTLDNMTYWD